MAYPIRISAQGNLFEIKQLGQPAPLCAKDTTRGTITEFSRKSRTRIIKLFASMTLTTVRARFVTLTFKGNVTDATSATLCFKRFVERFRRQFPDGSAVWRKERQERGAWHYHLMIFGTGYWKQDELLAAWRECCGVHGGGARIEAIRTQRGVMSYVSKYIAKTVPDNEVSLFINSPYSHANTGKHWGYINRKALPMAQKMVFEVQNESLAYYIRHGMRGITRINHLMSGFCGFALLDNASEAWFYAAQLADKIESQLCSLWSLPVGGINYVTV